MAPAEPEPGDEKTPSKTREHHLQHVLGACFGALALGMVVATVAGVWLDAPGGPVRLVDPEELVRGGCAVPLTDKVPTDYLGTPCDSPRATVLVLDLVSPADEDVAHSIPRCPLGTDELVPIYSPPLEETDASAEPRDEPADAEPSPSPEITDIACVRNLYSPHPGDPGAGGGQLVAGDCGYIDESGGVAEADCNDSHEDVRFQVLNIVDDQIDCPEGSTEKYEMWPDTEYGEDGFLMVCAVPYGDDSG